MENRNLLIHQPDKVGLIIRQMERVMKEIVSAAQLRERTMELQAQAVGNEGHITAINLHINANLNTLKGLIEEVKDEIPAKSYSAHP